MTTYQIGSKSVSLDEVFAAGPPSRKEFARFCSTFGLLVESQNSFLDTARLTAESSRHPWLIYLMAEMYTRMTCGDTLDRSIQNCLKKLISLRIERMKDEFESFSGEPEQTTEHEKPYWDPTKKNQWVIPDYFGYFSDFIQFVDAAEESGELDTAMTRLYEINANAGVVGVYDEIWGRDVSVFCSLLELLTSAGIPTRKCIEIIRRSSPLRSELDVVIRELDNGSADQFGPVGDRLAACLAQTKGKLSHPMLVALIEAGESAGEFEICLARIQRKQAKSRELQIAGRV